ncbi:MAG: hypothetical protein O6761_06900 [Thaumarchaeota archaeon]|nr:hypothetical protein [Nitrososphaerota archaeon]
MKYIGLDEYYEIQILMGFWGKTLWKLHTSPALVRLYDCEEDRQKRIRQIA